MMIKTALFFKKKKEETEEEKKKREDDNKHSAKRTMLKSLKYHALGGAVSAGLGYYSAKKANMIQKILIELKSIIKINTNIMLNMMKIH